MNKIPKALKFIISGGLAAVSKLGFFLLFFYVLNFYYLLSSGVAFALSVIVGFFMQKYFTFEDLSKEGVHKKAAIFFFVSMINLLINIFIMYIFVSIFSLNELLSQILSIGIIALGNYFIYQKFVFGSKTSNL